MRRRPFLRFVALCRLPPLPGGLLDWYVLGQQQSVEKLLSDQILRQTERFGDDGGTEPLLRVELPRNRSWQQEFARKDVRLQLAALVCPVVFNALEAYGCRFCR